MSTPMYKTKEQAVLLWGNKAPLKRVYVPASRGFLHAPKSGFYWTHVDIARELKLRASK